MYSRLLARLPAHLPLRNRQVSATNTSVVWVAVPDLSHSHSHSHSDASDGTATATATATATVTAYVALFNIGKRFELTISVSLADLGVPGSSCKTVRDVWSGEAKPATEGGLVKAEVSATGVVLLALQDCV